MGCLIWDCIHSNQSKAFFALNKKRVAQLVRLLMASNKSPQTENEQLRARAVKKRLILPTIEHNVPILIETDLTSQIG